METFKQVVKLLAFASLLFTVVEVYLTLNRLWIRRQERAVAESISMMAKLIGLIPLTVFAVDNLFIGQWRGFIDNALWIGASCVQVAIAAGIWVAVTRGKSTLQLVAGALRVERAEVGQLAKAILRPASSGKVLDVMSQLALIDRDLDAREKQLLREFGEAWGGRGDVRPSILDGALARSARVERLHSTIADYLATSPPADQLEPVADVLTLLAHADGTVAREEETALAEIRAMLRERHGESAAPRYFAAVVPATPAEERDFAAREHGLAPAKVTAFVSGPFYSRRFADVVVAEYRDRFASAVLDPAQVGGRAAG